jgi:hypothetical protein
MRSPLLTLCTVVATATFSTHIWAGADPSPSPDNALADQQIVNQGGNGDLQQFGDLDGTLWMTNAPIPTPNGTSQTTTASDCFGYVYVIGGGTGVVPDVTLNLLMRYAPADNTWTQMANIPSRLRAFGAVALVDGEGGPREKFYVFGGFDGVNPLATLHIYDVLTDAWTTGAPVPHPEGVFGAGVCQVNGRIFVAGGASTFAFTDAYEYHLDTNTYSSVAPMPGGGTYRTHAAGIDALGECHFMSNGFDLQQHYVYNVASNTWATAQIIPTPVFDPAVVAVDTDVYVMAGPPGQTAVTQIYNTMTHTWSNGPNLPGPTNNTSGTLNIGMSPATIFVEGGYNGSTSIPPNYSYALPGDSGGDVTN